MPVGQRTWAIVPAAGMGSRCGGAIPKQYIKIGNKTVLDHTLSVLLSHKSVAGVVVVIAADDPHWASSNYAQDARVHPVHGGAERCDSVLNGLRHLSVSAQPGDRVMVHDAARPCLEHDDMDLLLRAGVSSTEGVILAVPVKDTLKRASREGGILSTVDREALWHALTPQLFPLGALITALERAAEKNQVVTDEASAMELSGAAPSIVQGKATNLKITVPEDLIMAKAIMASQGRFE